MTAHNHPALSMAGRLCTPSDIARVRESIALDSAVKAYERVHALQCAGVHIPEAELLDVRHRVQTALRPYYLGIAPC